MGIRSGFDPCGSADIMVDQNLGGAYKNVRTVAMHINQVIKLASSFDDGSLIPNIGEKGAKGDKGDTGPKGERGDTGDRGPRGFIGDDGASSYDLWIGQGNVGSLAQYLASLKGPAGPKGADGAAAAKGDTGDVGPRGPAGIAGAEGPTGPAGPRGERGQAGQDGADGQRGPQGIAGTNGTNGAKGDTGAKGADGAKGTDGAKGADGIGITAMTINSDNHLIVTLSNGSQIDAGLIGNSAPQATTANTDETSSLDVEAVLGAVAAFREVDELIADRASKLNSINNRLIALGN